MPSPSPCACTRVRRAARSLTRLYDGALAEAGLTTTQYAVLRTLARLGTASVTDLAQATGHERSAMTRTLRPLEIAGFVASGSGADQRSRGVGITAAGSDAIARAEPGWRLAQARIDAALGEGDRIQLYSLLDRVEAIGAEAGR